VTPSAPPPAPPKPTTAPAAPQPTVAAEEAAIRATLREYAAAIQKLEVEAVQRVYPGVNEAALRRSFSGLSSMQVQIVGDEQMTIEGATAVVRCQVRQSFRPKVGQGRTETVVSVFRLQKTGGRWIIVERR
jgi:ketosteroid isomerase-like protein